MVEKIRKEFFFIITSSELLSIGAIKEKSYITSIVNRKKNRLPHFRIGHSLRFLKDDVIDFIKKNKQLDEEYDGKFLLSNKNLLRKKSKEKTIESRILDKVNLLEKDFSESATNRNNPNDPNNEEWIIAALNFSARLLTDSIFLIYGSKDSLSAFHSLLPKLEGLLSNKKIDIYITRDVYLDINLFIT